MGWDGSGCFKGHPAAQNAYEPYTTARPPADHSCRWLQQPHAAAAGTSLGPVSFPFGFCGHLRPERTHSKHGRATSS